MTASENARVAHKAMQLPAHAVIRVYRSEEGNTYYTLHECNALASLEDIKLAAKKHFDGTDLEPGVYTFVVWLEWVATTRCIDSAVEYSIRSAEQIRYDRASLSF